MALSKRVQQTIVSNSYQEGPSHFFKVILPSSLQDKKLRLPGKFVRKFGHELSTSTTLIVPNGRFWQVSLIKDSKSFWFHDGWHDFVEYHSITAGYFLVFKYRRNSTFCVLIFDLTACEINYPHMVEESQIEKQNDLENEDSDKIIGFANPNLPLIALENEHFDGYPSKGQSGSAQRTKKSCQYAAFLENPEVQQRCETQRKKCKIEEMMKINEQNDDNENSLLALLEEKGIFFAEKRRLVLSAEESERAINITRSFKPKNASLIVILSSSNNYFRHVYVPVEFASKCLSRHAKSIKVQVPNEKEWCLQIYRRYSGGFYLTKGWAEFLKAKKLGGGDICIFELTMMMDVLKLLVFHAS